MGAGVCHLMCICRLTEASQAGAGAGVQLLGPRLQFRGLINYEENTGDAVTEHCLTRPPIHLVTRLRQGHLTRNI